MGLIIGEHRIDTTTYPEVMYIYQALRTLENTEIQYGENRKLKCYKPLLDRLKQVVNSIEESQE